MGRHSELQILSLHSETSEIQKERSTATRASQAWLLGFSEATHQTPTVLDPAVDPAIWINSPMGAAKQTYQWFNSVTHKQSYQLISYHAVTRNTVHPTRSLHMSPSFDPFFVFQSQHYSITGESFHKHEGHAATLCLSSLCHMVPVGLSRHPLHAWVMLNIQSKDPVKMLFANRALFMPSLTHPLN